jgi:hypothetical protein
MHVLNWSTPSQLLLQTSHHWSLLTKDTYFSNSSELTYKQAAWLAVGDWGVGLKPTCLLVRVKPPLPYDTGQHQVSWWLSEGIALHHESVWCSGCLSLMQNRPSLLRQSSDLWKWACISKNGWHILISLYLKAMKNKCSTSIMHYFKISTLNKTANII